MLRILFYLLLVLVLGFGFAWIADYPGTVKLDWQNTEYEASLIVVISGLVAIIAAVLIVWTAIRIVLNSPRLMNRFFKQRKKDRGYTALSQGLIAAGSGDAVKARLFAKESSKLLTSEPLVKLLDAQTLLLEGNNEKARDKFEDMLEDDRTKLVALRGLFLEAEKQGAKEAAQQYVEEAAELAPSVPWAGNAMLRYRATQGDWAGALSALQSNRSSGLLEKKAATRQRAVLLTAYAMSQEQIDPAKSAKLAKEAHKLAPDLVPAAIVGARVLMRDNSLRRASRMIETVWKKSPHPELAETYVNLRVGDSALDRLKRARKLAALRTNHIEGSVAIAEAAIEAQEWQAARDAMLPIMSSAPTQRACLIMADIEEGESGDQGRMRDWLSRAVRAPKDAAWTADGLVSEKWLPFSPQTGELDAFEWKVPVEQLGGLQKPVIEADDLDGLMSSLAIGAGVGSAIASATKAPDVNGELKNETDIEKMPIKAEPVSDLVDAAIVESSEVDVNDIEDVVEGIVQKTDVDADANIESFSKKVKTKVVDEATDKNDDSNAKKTNVAEAKKARIGSKAKAKDVKDVDEASSTDDKSAETDSQVVFPLERRPDDPGVSDADLKKAESAKKRFGLF